MGDQDSQASNETRKVEPRLMSNGFLSQPLVRMVPYLASAILGVVCGFIYWWITMSEPPAEDIFFDALNELEQINSIKTVNKGYEYILVLYFTDITSLCGRSGLVRILSQLCPDNLKVVIAVDSSHTNNDVINARRSGDIFFEIIIITDDLSARWYKIDKHYSSIYGKHDSGYFDGVGILKSIRHNENRHKRVFIYNANILQDILRNLQNAY